MTIRSMIKRAATVGGATTALVLAGSMSASAHHCYIPMHSLDGPVSANWLVFSAEGGAEMFGIFDTTCDAQRDAGYAALREAGLPVGIKIFDRMTIGAGSNNPNLQNRKGLEHLSDEVGVADQMLFTYAGAASAVSCE